MYNIIVAIVTKGELATDMIQHYNYNNVIIIIMDKTATKIQFNMKFHINHNINNYG